MHVALRTRATRMRLPRCIVICAELQPALLLFLCSCGIALGPFGCRRSDDVAHSINLLKDPDPKNRYMAADELLFTKDPRAVEPLIAALNDPEPFVRAEVAVSLGLTGDPRGVEPLINRLQDPEPQVRVGVVSGLGSAKDPRGIDPLISALKDVDPSVRAKAADELNPERGFIRESRLVEPLVAALQDPASPVRNQAAYDLGVIDDPRARTALMNALKDPDGDVRVTAAKALPTDLLAKGLEKFGNQGIAEGFLNTENPKLKDAAEKWALEHGFKIE
jgi:HEAT repeat protein